MFSRAHIILCLPLAWQDGNYLLAGDIVSEQDAAGLTSAVLEQHRRCIGMSAHQAEKAYIRLCQKQDAYVSPLGFFTLLCFATHGSV
jgi:hypothetical protein